jgi:hypothetical protein
MGDVTNTCFRPCTEIIGNKYATVTILDCSYIMRYLSSKLALSSAMTVMAGMSLAQSYSSFNAVDGIYGVNLTTIGLAYTLAIDPGAYVMFNGNHLDIENCFGFWAMKPGTALSASGTNQNGWDWDQATSGGGSIAGWQNPNKVFAIVPGQQMTFTYTSLDQPSVESFGWHFSFVQDWPLTPGAKTAYVSGPLNPVPEPATLTAMGLGALAFIRRKRSARKS